MTNKILTKDGKPLKFGNGGFIFYSSTSPHPTGGELTFFSGDRIHTFESDGSFIVGNYPITASLLIVGGGGGGAIGGGGGGAVINLSNQILPANSTYTISIGQGGVGATGFGNTDFNPTWYLDPFYSGSSTVATNGEDSIITGPSLDYIAYGGGRGGTISGNDDSVRPGHDGGSGGGAGAGNYPGGNAINSYGNSGGSSLGNSGMGGGGGGGRITSGQNGGVGNLNNGGDGGQGSTSTITGTSQVYGSGGGGASRATNSSFITPNHTSNGGTNAGNGGFHDSPSGDLTFIDGTSAINGFGGGGGGAGKNAGSGGSGVIIIRYTPQF